MDTLENITLYNADCMDLLRQMPNKAYDLAIVDPPYGIGIDGQKGCVCKNPKHNRKPHENKGWDKIPPPLSILRNYSELVKTKLFLVQTTLCKILNRQRDGLCGTKGNKA